MDREFNINTCFPQVKPRTPKCLVHPVLNPLFPHLTASPAGMILPWQHCFCISHLIFVYRCYTELFNAMSGIYINAILLFQSFLRAQQCGVPNHSLRPGAEQLTGTAHPTEEDQEETEAQGEEKIGEEEGEAATQTSNAFWSPWTGEWVFSGSDPGKNSGYSPHLIEFLVWKSNHTAIRK